MRISDWSSDVCSSDLDQWLRLLREDAHGGVAPGRRDQRAARPPRRLAARRRLQRAREGGPGVDRGAHQPRPHRRPDRPEAPPCGALLGLRDRGAHRPDRHDQPLEPPHGGNPLAMIDDSDVAAFEQARPVLFGLAYRILGSYAEAEDAVQDTFVKWQAADRRAIETPRAWLTTVCTRRCLDLLQAGDRSRVAYVGPWLPEPVDRMSRRLKPRH